ncbi:uncharacterized protein LACBIDRAFT_318280 [Laccaria bicolor S238N-H82]|uniref:Predicted protein n=1 Tax=Laccaria bicolor (strain S238N-H82 / ATCC MYA-4686) TaxID=486041 RepID=B0D6D3_LACBS|nr:uncharacterized protein LACBIDRAFT_318280 [Laccaria bicolor S238N-H82]EDR09931.1 predicted protein [Laccaria bicolor S238N-H82]|eukprot:XP_001879316.1 predicted protein [Laccaria bicolor S238N-H82]
MEVYTKPPRPPAHPFVKHQEGAQVDAALESREIGKHALVPPIRAPGTSRKLVRRFWRLTMRPRKDFQGIWG